MDDSFWTQGLRVAGGCHLLTVVLAHLTPIPRDWDKKLGELPPIHRRFAVAQNIFIGGTMVFAGLVSLLFASELVSGSITARILCAGIAVWWVSRWFVLFWLRVWPELRTPLLRSGFVLLHAECVAFAVVYGWLAIRPI